MPPGRGAWTALAGDQSRRPRPRGLVPPADSPPRRAKSPAEPATALHVEKVNYGPTELCLARQCPEGERYSLPRIQAPDNVAWRAAVGSADQRGSPLGGDADVEHRAVTVGAVPPAREIDRARDSRLRACVDVGATSA